MIVGNIDYITKLTVRRLDTGEELHLAGREAWCMAQLINVRGGGTTSFERPAPRWSDYVFKLRKRGIPIETIEESHGGPYRGAHARYFLRVAVEVINQQYQSRAA
jgi:hypothetical protein